MPLLKKVVICTDCQKQEKDNIIAYQVQVLSYGDNESKREKRAWLDIKMVSCPTDEVMFSIFEDDF